MLSKKAIERIQAAVAKVFDRAKAKLLGKDYGTVKAIRISGPTVGDLYEEAALANGAPPDAETRTVIETVAENYLEAQQAAATARVVKDISAALVDARARGEEVDVPVVLGGALAETWGAVTAGVRRIVESEATTARNFGALEGISFINEKAGIEDPVMFFVVARRVHADAPCEECVRLHLMPDRITPRLWLRSEISSGYHTKGDATPCMCGLHPHCRCVPTTLMPGWGFNGSGKVTFISPSHDEFKAQRGL